MASCASCASSSEFDSSSANSLQSFVDAKFKKWCAEHPSELAGETLSGIQAAIRCGESYLRALNDRTPMVPVREKHQKMFPQSAQAGKLPGLHSHAHYPSADVVERLGGEKTCFLMYLSYFLYKGFGAEVFFSGKEFPRSEMEKRPKSEQRGFAFQFLNSEDVVVDLRGFIDFLREHQAAYDALKDENLLTRRAIFGESGNGDTTLYELVSKLMGEEIKGIPIESIADIEIVGYTKGRRGYSPTVIIILDGDPKSHNTNLEAVEEKLFKECGWFGPYDFYQASPNEDLVQHFDEMKQNRENRGIRFENGFPLPSAGLRQHVVEAYNTVHRFIAGEV